MRKILLIPVATLLFGVSLLGAGKDGISLLKAVKSGDLPSVQKALRAHHDPSEAEPDGTTSLHWAVQENRLDIANALLAAGANVNALNHFGASPLAVAFTCGNSAAAAELLKAGANPHAPIPEMGTPLLAAARLGDTALIKALVKAGVNADEPEPSSGQTALATAAREGHLEAIKTLLAAGADVRKRSKREETALFFAVREGHTAVVDALLAGGADVNERAGSSATRRAGLAAAPSKEKVPGDTMLVVAIINAHFTLADFLLSKGADPNLTGADWTPLHALARARNYEEIQYPPPILTPGDLDSLELAKHLIAHGADVNARGGPEPARRAGSDQNYKDLLGATPFFLAAKSADVPLMKILAAAKADLTIPEVDGTTPLMVAAGVGCVPGQWVEQEKDVLTAVKYLVEDLKADVNERNKGNETPLHGAACRAADSVIQYLADKGAKFVKNSEDQTPLDVAVDGLNRAASINGPPIVIFRFPDHTVALMKKEAEKQNVSLTVAHRVVSVDHAAQAISVWDGVYNSAQADRGKSLYTQQCVACHGNALEGKTAPALAAPAFKADYEGLTANDLVDYVQRSMPRGRAGTLTREQSTHLVAFLLKSNGFPSGDKELSGDADSLNKIRIEAKKPSN
jgi:ankyrin repeat protein/cytochrome c5